MPGAGGRAWWAAPAERSYSVVLAALILTLAAAGCGASPRHLESDAAAKPIPGLDQRVTLTALRHDAFLCEPVAAPYPGGSAFYCVSNEGSPTTPSETVGVQSVGVHVCHLEATAFGTTASGLPSLLDPIADLAFHNAQDAEAHRWIQVSSNSPDAQTQIGGIHLELRESQVPEPPSWRLILTAA